jgi:uncharacterized protein (DUF58 family)
MKARKIVFLVPAGLLVLALLAGSELVLRVFFLSVLVPLVSYLWTVFGTRGVGASAEAPPEHCQVGERFQQEITVRNDSRIPKPWLRVAEESDLPGHRANTLITLGPWSSQNWKASVQCRLRGLYHLGEVTVTASDPFGIFSRQNTVGERHELLVYPATVDLPLFKASSFNDFGYGSGYQSISLISPNASSVREFGSGDSLNHIHWPGTAHAGKLMVKVFDADRSYNSSKTIWIVLDMHSPPHSGHGEEATEEYGVTIAASLARKHMDSGMRVGLMMAGDESVVIPPERGDDHLWRILETLALVKATGETPVGQLISDRTEYLRGNSVVIVVTPAVTGGLVDALRQLRNRVDSVVTILLDAESFGGDAGATAAARNLSTTGVQVYLVRQGDELARALDHRVSILHARYV